jgi:uncharacterized protein DUF992
MLKKVSRVVVAAGFLALAVPGSPAPAPAQSGVKAGMLSCNVAAGWGFIIGSSKQVNCTFAPNAGAPERYTGSITKFGADIGYSAAAVMVWGVFAPAADVKPGALAGTYAGATAGAAVGVGVGANVLVGGSDKSVALQPLSVEGSVGLNVAAGVAGLNLQAAK